MHVQGRRKMEWLFRVKNAHFGSRHEKVGKSGTVGNLALCKKRDCPSKIGAVGKYAVGGYLEEVL